jgi:hypothetical protein
MARQAAVARLPNSGEHAGTIYGSGLKTNGTGGFLTSLRNSGTAPCRRGGGDGEERLRRH